MSSYTRNIQTFLLVTSLLMSCEAPVPSPSESNQEKEEARQEHSQSATSSVMGVTPQSHLSHRIASKPLQHALNTRGHPIQSQDHNTVVVTLSSMGIPQVIDVTGTSWTSLGHTSSLSAGHMTSHSTVEGMSHSSASSSHNVGAQTNQIDLVETQPDPQVGNPVYADTEVTEGAIPQFEDIIPDDGSDTGPEDVDELKNRLEIFKGKLERRREQNRRAARRSRQKKRDKGQDLLKTTQQLASENAKLRNEIMQLNTERSLLRTNLIRHMATCPLAGGATSSHLMLSPQQIQPVGTETQGQILPGGSNINVIDQPHASTRTVSIPMPTRLHPQEDPARTSESQNQDSAQSQITCSPHVTESVSVPMYSGTQLALSVATHNENTSVHNPAQNEQVVVSGAAANSTCSTGGATGVPTEGAGAQRNVDPVDLLLQMAEPDITAYFRQSTSQ